MLFSWRKSHTWVPILGPRRGGATALRRRLPSLFDGVLVYHAARPVNVRTYYQRGLLLGDHLAQRAMARRIFLSREFPELTNEAFQAADCRLLPIEDGQAFVSLDSRGFLDGAGHYLIYGSEYLCGLAAGLSAHRDYRQVLKRRGIPTIFRLRLQFGMVSDSDLTAFADLLYEHIPVIRSRMGAPQIDFTFRLRSPLPARCVLSHVHPRLIVDPLLGMTPYNLGARRPLASLASGGLRSRNGLRRDSG
jgi:hypothetical protein